MKCLSKTLAMSLFVAMSITASADNLLKDASFSNESGWFCWVEKPALDAGGSLTLQDGKAVAKSAVVKNQTPSNLQLIKDVVVEADKSYKITFKANADKAGSLTVTYILSKAPYTGYADTIVTLEPGEKVYECTLAVKKGKDGKYEAPRSLRLFFGAFKDATVTVSDISLEEIK
jgi:hypothetical protein